jgi:hypothetical protein
MRALWESHRPVLRAPFVPGRAITFQIDISQSPPQIVRFDDSGERLANIPWCEDCSDEWLEAFPQPE